jgi:aminoglycoside/choline kinase family phosphotransferase
MFVPDGAKPDEIAKAGVPSGRWPFLEVRDLLAARGVDVPHVYGADMAHGWVLLEDLGDDTLAVFLSAHPERKEELYVRAVSDLAQAQKALATLDAGSVVATRAFDEDLLLWEIHHFREWALEERAASSSAPRTARSSMAWPRASPGASPPDRACSSTATTSRAT